jgi:hypothetical protein
MSNPSAKNLVETLRQQIARLEAGRRVASGPVTVSTGCTPLDGVLSDGGFYRGTLVEWFSATEGSGAETLAIRAATVACRDGGAVVVLDRQREFYPPAAVRAGIALDRLIVLQPRIEADVLWTLDQALRCVGVAVVLAWFEKLDGRDFRRLQLAAEEGGTLGFLIRPASVRHEPSWADVRLLVEPLPSGRANEGRRLRVEVLRCRGGAHGATVEMEIDDAAYPLYPVPMPLPLSLRHAAGA